MFSVSVSLQMRFKPLLGRRAATRLWYHWSRGSTEAGTLPRPVLSENTIKFKYDLFICMHVTPVIRLCIC